MSDETSTPCLTVAEVMISANANPAVGAADLDWRYTFAQKVRPGYWPRVLAIWIYRESDPFNPTSEGEIFFEPPSGDSRWDLLVFNDFFTRSAVDTNNGMGWLVPMLDGQPMDLVVRVSKGGGDPEPDYAVTASILWKLVPLENVL
jgi:hypothetical protein